MPGEMAVFPLTTLKSTVGAIPNRVAASATVIPIAGRISSLMIKPGLGGLYIFYFFILKASDAMVVFSINTYESKATF
jgi:hypothetical protein